MIVDVNGSWSSDQSGGVKEATIFSHGRPHMYYFAILDCNGNMERTYKDNPKGMPRTFVSLTLLNEGSHFSYEDIGSYDLSFWMLFG